VADQHPLPDFDDILAAAQRIASRIHHTPVFTSASLDRELEANLFFKCENLQRTGAFKFRGASNAVWSLPDDEARRGVATHSSGNHGAALARAAAERGVPCWVVMPEDAPRVKREAVRTHGAKIVSCGTSLASREETAERVLEETGAVLIHPYDDPSIIAGQGTCALELVQEVEGLDLLMAPIGGGGLLSGTALVASRLAPSAEVVGAEPAGADDAYRSLAAGRITPVPEARTVAEGLRATIGELPFAILSSLGARVVTVDDQATLAAMRWIWQRLKLVIEPSSAVPVAALRQGAVEAFSRRVGVILSGGNVDFPDR
jgi:threonine dehydratase